jgi:hypothetical protein
VVTRILNSLKNAEAQPVDPPKKSEDGSFLDFSRKDDLMMAIENPQIFRALKHTSRFKPTAVPTTLDWDHIEKWWTWLPKTGRYLAEIAIGEDRPNEIRRESLWDLLCPKTQNNLHFIFANGTAREETVDWVVDAIGSHLRETLGDLEAWLRNLKKRNLSFEQLGQLVYDKVSHLTIGFHSQPILAQNKRIREILVNFAGINGARLLININPSCSWQEVCKKLDQEAALSSRDYNRPEYSRAACEDDSVAYVSDGRGRRNSQDRGRRGPDRRNGTGTRLCYCCGKEGHIMYECPAKDLPPEKEAKRLRAIEYKADQDRKREQRESVAAFEEHEGYISNEDDQMADMMAHIRVQGPPSMSGNC